MATVFAQVWVLCLIAFLLGALVTWLALSPARRRAAPPVVPPAEARLDPVQAAQAPPTPLPGVPRHARRTPANPAPASLESHRRRPGSPAVNALGRLRHSPPEGPIVPRQQGPRPSGEAGELFRPPSPRAPED
jgi:hypothetical protein